MTTANPTQTRLYAFGSNGAGQLGLGHLNDLNVPEQCLFQDSKSNNTPSSNILLDDTIQKIVAGGNHTLLLTQKGRVYASGNNDSGKCAILDGRRNIEIFTLVDWTKGRNITDVAVTWETSYFVEDGAKIWVCGSGAKGELGLGADVPHCSTPTLIFDSLDLEGDDCRVAAISGGMSHVVVLSSNGEVHGWGSSRKGELGKILQYKKVVWEPEKLKMPFFATQIATGRDFTVICGDKQSPVLFGEVKPPEARSRVESIGICSRIQAGWTTVYAIQQSSIQGFGQGLRGQVPPPDLPPIAYFSVGSEHCIALSEDGLLLSWGWGEHGNCGSPVDHRGNVIGTFNIIPTPTSDGVFVAGVGAGCATSFVWTTTERPKK